jgi:hypothetical protein
MPGNLMLFQDNLPMFFDFGSHGRQARSPPKQACRIGFQAAPAYAAFGMIAEM